MVTKTDSESEFYRKVASQLDNLFMPIIQKAGGAMSLIDVYLYYNRMRGSSS